MSGAIFISYRRADESWARLLHKQLKDQGVDAWYDAHVGAGEDWRAATANALQASHIFVLLFSRAAADSQDITKELAAATYSKKLVVPVRIEDIEPSGAFLYELASRNWFNAFDNTEVRLAELARSLAKLVKAGISDESVIPFDRNAGARVAARKPRWLTRRHGVIAAAAAVILAAGGAAALLMRSPSPGVRIAILPFEVLGDERELTFFAAELADAIGGVFTANQLQTISRAQVAALAGSRETALGKLGVAFYLGGTVQSHGEMTQVTVHLDDARGNITLWSEEFSRPSNASSALEGEVGAKTTSIVLTALDTVQRGGGGKTQDLSAFIRANALLIDNDYQGARQVTQYLVAQQPNSGKAHSMLAIASLGVARQVPAEQAEPLLAEVKREAERAIQQDPNIGESYLALGYLKQRADWRGREALFFKGSVLDPNWPYLPYHISKHLWAVGRLKDALPADERGLALMPFHAGLNAQRAIELASVGRLREAKESVDRTVQLWPTNPWSRSLRLWFTTFFRPPSETLALLDSPDLLPAELEPAGIAAWREFVKARKPGDGASGSRAIKDIVAAGDSHALDRANAVQALAMLGEVGAALDQLSQYIGEAGDYHRGMLVLPPAVLFYPTTAAIRRDPRFMPFAAKLGLVDYWRITNKWPEFCDEPGLPYDCRKEADRVAAIK